MRPKASRASSPNPTANLVGSRKAGHQTPRRNSRRLSFYPSPHPPRAAEQRIDRRDRDLHPLLVRSAQEEPRHALRAKRLLEPAVHSVPDVFTVAHAVVYERDLVAGQEIKIAAARLPRRAHGGVVAADVTP